MFSQNMILPPENPRPAGFASKPMGNEIAKPPPSILVGRFKALLKQRDDELRATSVPVPPPSTDEIVQIYELLLSELTCNLKPIITDLTIIAEQQREHAKGIADAICARILEVPVDQKLPSLYLLDSIVKNFGQEYIRYFSLRLPEVFCEAYRQVQPSLHSAMRHLFGTWSKVFPPSVLHKIEAELQFSQAVNTQSSTPNPVRASESSRPSHGIHVNPKYLRQLERSTVDSFCRAPPGQVPGSQNQINHSLGSSQPHDAWKISHHPSNIFSNRGRARNLMIPPIDNIRNTDNNPYWVRPAVSRMEAHPSVLPAPFEMRPSVNVNVTRPPIINPLQKHVRSQFDAMNTSNPIANHVVNKSSFMPEQSFDSVENKDASILKIHQLPNQLSGVISSNQQNHGQAQQLQFFPSQDPSTSQFSHGSSLQGHGVSISTAMSNPLPVLPFPLPFQSISNNPLHLQGGAHPPLPPGRPPAPSQMIPHPNAGAFMPSQQPTVGYTNLISSLMSQGVISLANQLPAQDSVGTEFNPDILKIRHESAVNALYGDLPRQCTTCALRFKCQEEHSSHMDWHVTKNRMSKSRKQKPSRKWFVSDRMWLSGAEALGTESAPGFLPTETIEEMKDHEELAVPAEEDQNTCALCGEPFDEFYSDEMEEWMYRGAVYLNAPLGITAGMDRSQLGPIIHAKCRSESNMATSEDLGLDEKGADEEGSQRKRMRS
ncbi:Polyadenylation and cleavage factor-like 4 isoform D [Glycine soja]|uniref:Polyadenylation and cleavage factor-like 4 isoform D n=1 Tax=Glycine soja TaxID=3848 RepID=A0A445ISL2_GLYSO|nr:Polyadenylation and cleavage factor-like 4 isoform D [Glycine soja]